MREKVLNCKEILQRFFQGTKATYLATASLYTKPASALFTISKQRSAPSILQAEEKERVKFFYTQHANYQEQDRQTDRQTDRPTLTTQKPCRAFHLSCRFPGVLQYEDASAYDRY